MKFNVNQRVKVKLTERGKQWLREDHLNYWHQVGITALPRYKPPKEDEEGWSEWQLWALMKSLGKYCAMGGDLPFEPTIILMEDIT